MIDYNKPPKQYGWECPNCRSVYSPLTRQCFNCPQKTSIGTTSTDTGVMLSGITSGNTYIHHCAFEKSLLNDNCKYCGKPESEHHLKRNT